MFYLFCQFKHKRRKNGWWRLIWYQDEMVLRDIHCASLLSPFDSRWQIEWLRIFLGSHKKIHIAKNKANLMLCVKKHHFLMSDIFLWFFRVTQFTHSNCLHHEHENLIDIDHIKTKRLDVDWNIALMWIFR